MSRPFSHLLPACTSFVRVSYRKSFRIFGAGKRGRNRRGQKKHHAFPDGVLIRYFKSAEALAPVLKVKLVSLGVHDADEIERVLTTFAAERNGGVAVGPHAGNMAIYGPSGLVHACLQTSCWVVQLRVQGELPAGFRVPVVGPTTTQAFWQFITWVSQATKQAVDV